MTAPTVTALTEAQGLGTPGDVESAPSALDALAVSGVTGRGEPVGNGLELAIILRAAARIIEQVDEPVAQRFGLLGVVLRHAMAVLRGGISR